MSDFTNFNSTAQQNKLSFKSLFLFCLMVSLSLFSNSLLAQPTSFDVSGCTGQPGSDGSYTQGADYNGCPCYEKSGGGAIFKSTPSIWGYQAGVSCTTIIVGGVIFDAGTDPCDISQVTPSSLGGCNPSVLSNFQYAAATPAGIPTLSEWGLIVLALLLMTMGTLYLVQPKEEMYLLKDVEE